MDDYKAFDGLTKKELLDLIKKEGRPDDLDSQQNYSPTVKEMIEATNGYKAYFRGYVIGKKRDDWRVSVDGFSVTDLTAEQALFFMKEYGSADSSDYEKVNDKFSVSFWWD